MCEWAHREDTLLEVELLKENKEDTHGSLAFCID